MLHTIKNNIYIHYLLGTFLILFFFLRMGEYFLNTVNPNWAYIFDQSGLGLIVGTITLVWLKKRNEFNLGWLASLMIILLVIIAHYHSFYRPFWFDELRNIVNKFPTFDGFHGDPSSIDFGFAGPGGTREKYPYWISAFVYEIIGIGKPYFIFIWSASGILLLTGAALTTAWLTGVLSNSRLSALIAGLLIGVTPNSFMSLRWVSNIQRDGIGVILVTLTLGVWYIARKSKDSYGIFLALILLAATLKGGGVVRTATTGGLLILTDIVFFSEFIKKEAWKDWIKVVVVSGLFYVLNPAVHWQPSTNPSSETMTFLTRLSFLADATTRSFITPLPIMFLFMYLRNISTTATWTVVLGTIFFVVGTGIAVFSLFKKRYRYFAWGWVWFYVFIWYIPWLGELHAKPDDIVSDITNAGYEFAYLSLVGLYIAVGIFLGRQIIKIRLQEHNKKIIGRFFLLLTIAFLGWRITEFLILDYRWRVDYSNRVGPWYNLVFGTIPPPQKYSSEQSKTPKVLVELDTDHIGMEAELFIPTMYYDGSLLFYRDLDLFYKEIILEKKIPPQRIYAIEWNDQQQKIINHTDAFRHFLLTSLDKPHTTIDFSKWKK